MKAINPIQDGLFWGCSRMGLLTAFLEGCSWFKFNNLGLALGMNLKFHTSLSKGLKLKVKKFLGLILTFVEVTGENQVGFFFCPTHPILNRVKPTFLLIKYSVPTILIEGTNLLRIKSLNVNFSKYQKQSSVGVL